MSKAWDACRSRSFVGELRNDAIEFLEGEAFVGWGFVIDVRAVHHFQQLVVIQSFMDPFANGFEIFVVNDSVLISIEDGEDSFQSVLGFGFSNFVSNAVKELFEIDGFVLVFETNDQAQDEGISFINAQLFESFADLRGIDTSTVVFVKDFKGVLEISVVFWG